LCEAGLGFEALADHVLTLPVPVDPLLAALHYLLPLQLLAYEWAVARGLNPDTPKSMRAILDAVLPPDREEPELR
jgi:fructoselysine-6-P-deglycase FrlB-like protein